MEFASNLNPEHSLGKGEVVSSILPGSTIYACETRLSERLENLTCATPDATEREHDASTRGKPVEFVRGQFAAQLEAHKAELGDQLYHVGADLDLLTGDRSQQARLEQPRHREA